jgi:TIR domain-containing protein
MRLRRIFEGCVARLEAAGLVKRLEFGDLILLQPELIDGYAGAIVNAARAEPDGLGSILQDDVLALNFPFPEKERIADPTQEKLLLIATLEELIRHEIVLKEETDEGALLIFPMALGRDLNETVQASETTVEFTFEGPVVSIYTTLIVRLARSGRFARHSVWRSVAQFESDSGGICTVRLVLSDEGRGTFQVGYGQGAAEVVGLRFDRFVTAHLERRAVPGTVQRKRLYQCPNCGVFFGAAVVEEVRRRKQTTMFCPVDLTRVRLEDPYAFGAQDDVIREMDAAANAARSIATASSVILGKEETTDFDVFLCHNTADKPAVRLIAQRLRERGILPWFDETELPPGRTWRKELERQIASVRTAAVFVGPSGIGPWQSHELDALLIELTQRGCLVIPVLLPGAAAPELPVFLKGLTWVDLQDRNDDGIARLIWGITSHKPA